MVQDGDRRQAGRRHGPGALQGLARRRDSRAGQEAQEGGRRRTREAGAHLHGHTGEEAPAEHGQ
eukprot:4996732-Lingulodinium_polyedra.AAC.1